MLSPMTEVLQLLLPAMICAPLRTSGLTATTPGTSLSIARASSTVSVPAPPKPVKTPPRLMLPEKTWMTFWPRAAMRAWTWALAPLPMPTMAMTAPTPMMMPSMVRAGPQLVPAQRAEGDFEDDEVAHGQ